MCCLLLHGIVQPPKRVHLLEPGYSTSNSWCVSYPILDTPQCIVYLCWFIDIYSTHIIYSPTKLPGWWFPPLWKIWKSVGMMTFPTEWKVIKFHGSNHQPAAINMLLQDFVLAIPGFPTKNPKNTSQRGPFSQVLRAAEQTTTWGWRIIPL